MGGIAAGKWVLAGMVASAAVVVLAGCTAGVDVERDTYAFTEPQANAAVADPARTILVRNDTVAVVWVSESARADGLYGYTPQTIAGFRRAGAAIKLEDGVPTERCSDEGGTPACEPLVDVHTVSKSDAGSYATLNPPRSGRWLVTQRSVTWDFETTWQVHIAGDTFSSVEWFGGEPGVREPSWQDVFELGHNRVLYRIAGTDEEFAVCEDDPDMYDEEYCWTWSQP